MCKKTIRPKLNLQPASTEIEIFQNRVLRPILKLQNDFLVVMFKNYCRKYKIQKDCLSDKITQVFKDTSFRNMVLGTILGLLTLDELEFYSTNESELKKRITVMLKKRLLDNLIL